MKRTPGRKDGSEHSFIAPALQTRLLSHQGLKCHTAVGDLQKVKWSAEAEQRQLESKVCQWSKQWSALD